MTQAEGPAATEAAEIKAEQDEAAHNETVKARLREFAAQAKDPELEGAAAFNALCNIQAVLLEEGFPLDQDAGYVFAGYRNFKDFRKRLTRQALLEAKRNYELAREKGEVERDAATIAEHPVADMEKAFEWLKLSQAPMFADSTFKVLDSTRTDFYSDLKFAQKDAAYQKLRIATGIAVDPGEGDDALGYRLMTDVIEVHLAKLGVYGIDAHIEGQLGWGDAQVDQLYRHFCMREARRILIEANKRRFAPNSPEYQQLILDAWDVTLKTSHVETMPELYEGTGFTFEKFDSEFERCSDAVLTRIMDRLTTASVNVTQVLDDMDALKKLRNLWGEAEVPAQSDPVRQGDDYWMSKLLEGYGYKSFTHLLDQLCVIAASGTLRNRLQTQDDSSATETYDDFTTARSLLRDAAYAVDHVPTLQEIDIDPSLYFSALYWAAPFAANRDWSLLFKGNVEITDRIRLYDMVEEALEITRRGEEDSVVTFHPDDLEGVNAVLHLRRAEELLADYCLCFDSSGAHKLLKEAFGIFDDLGIDFFSKSVLKGMGLPQGTAIHMDNHFTLLEMVEEWRGITNEDLELAERFDKMQNFRKPFAELEPEDREAFCRYLRLDNPPHVEAMAVEMAKNLYAASLQELELYRDDVVKADEILRIAKSCVVAIEPRALEKDMLFLRTVGGDRTKFLAECAKYDRLAQAATKPLSGRFADAGGAVAILAEALKPQYKGRTAYDMVGDLAFQLGEEGRSILDADVLGPVGMKPADLKKFIDAQALYVARDYADSARAKRGVPITLKNLDYHAYNDYVQAMNWVARLQDKTVLADRHWQALGFASRADFADQMREALLDMMAQTDANVIREGVANGPLLTLQALHEVRHGYSMLGLESPIDIPDAKDQDRLTQHGGGIDTTQRAIVRLGYAAYRQIMASPLSVSTRYKQLSFVLGFSQQMKAREWGDVRKVTEVNEGFESLIRTRIENAVAKYKKRPGTPGRAVALSYGIRFLVNKHSLEKKSWLDELFIDAGYPSFEAFCDYAVIQRIRQIGIRSNRTANENTKEQMADPALHLRVVRDMERIENLGGDDGLVTGQRLVEIFQNLGLEEGWHHTTRRISAMFALPQLAKQAADPTLSDPERLQTIAECEALASMIGPRTLQGIKVDWKRIGTLREKTVVRLAASHLASDMMRGEFDVMSGNVLDAHYTLSNCNWSLADTEILRRMELKPFEIGRLQGHIPLFPAYQQLARLERGGMIDLREAADILMKLYQGAESAGYDLLDDDAKKVLGLADPAGFQRTLDRITLRVLTGICGGLEDQKARGEVEKMQFQKKFIADMLAQTRIENRFDAGFLREHGIMTSREVQAWAIDDPAKPKMPAGVLSGGARVFSFPAPANNN